MIVNKLKESNLKITPQRVMVLKSVSETTGHPTAEDVFKSVKKKLPNIAVGTVYNILEALVENGLVEKISTRGDKMRYDLVYRDHHHLFSKDSDMIRDYFDEELSGVIGSYLKAKEIPGFKVTGFKLNISGEFSKNDKN
ncbi:MAG: transcriptional repressor [Acidobacteriota bacterium]